MGKPVKAQQRRFLGELTVMIDRTDPVKEAMSRWNRAFHQAMLKAYLKGAEVFRFGFTTNKNGMRVPQQYRVLQEYL